MVNGMGLEGAEGGICCVGRTVVGRGPGGWCWGICRDAGLSGSMSWVCRP